MTARHDRAGDAKPDTTRLRCACGARCVAYRMSIETYSLANPAPALDRIPMHLVVLCERGHVHPLHPVQGSLFEVMV